MNHEDRKALDSIEESLICSNETPTKKQDLTLDLAATLLKLPEISESLKQLLQHKESELSTLDSIQNLGFELEKLSIKTDQNLKLTETIENRIDRKLRGLDAFEAKYSVLLGKISAVLTQLEQSLNSMEGT